LRCEGANLRCEGANLRCEGANLRCEGANLRCEGANLRCWRSNVCRLGVGIGLLEPAPDAGDLGLGAGEFLELCRPIGI
jgi:hypothetical protein